ncbi:MAG TPA: winged helix-turn-helix domain-containing protein [Terriglobales bacterium]|nr:winged helix-turn-helix domain-containing protein [Terriglobales bacterium]
MTPRYRFGPFEADAAGTLHRDGQPVRLQAQPFQVLLLLLENSGQVVTRDQIRERLWPGTVVDFDHGLNTAMNKLRGALAAGAGGVEIIETVARSGYRLLVPVEALQSSPPEPAPEPARSLLTAPAEVPAANPTLAAALFVAAQLMYLAFYVAALGHLDGVATALRWWRADETLAFWVILATACAGIPVRLFLAAAAALRAPRMRPKILRMFPALFALDVVWAFAPLLLVPRLSLGLALAACAALALMPFAQRTLALMGAAAA